MGAVEAQFHIFINWELAGSTPHAQDAILPRYGGSRGTVPFIPTLRTSGKYASCPGRFSPEVRAPIAISVNRLGSTHRR